MSSPRALCPSTGHGSVRSTGDRQTIRLPLVGRLGWQRCASIARGALVNYREWYGMKPNEPNVGLRMTAEAIAAGIKSREADDPQPMIGVADPAMFAEDGGPSIAHRMMGGGVIFRPADNKRVAGRGAMGGWDQVRARLDGDADGQADAAAVQHLARSDPHAAGAAARRRAAGGRGQRHGGPRPGQL